MHLISIQNSDLHAKNGLTTVATIFHYLDDTLGGHQIESKAIEQFEHSEAILRKLSLRTKESKAKPPSQVQQWLGKIYDTRNQWLKLPDEKVKKYVSDIESAIAKQSITKRYMGSIYRPLCKTNGTTPSKGS